MSNDVHSVPINLTTITPQSSMAQINNNFRKIQAELLGMRQNIEPRLRANEDFKDYIDTYLGGERPVSEKEAFQYTEEFTLEYAQKRISSSEAPPSSPEIGDLWLDPSTEPPTFRRWNGEAWEKLSVTTFQELEGMIDKEQLPDRVIDAMKLAIDAVQSENIAPKAVDFEHIMDEAITNAKLAADAVASINIQNDAINNKHLANLAITSEKLADGSIVSDKIFDGAVGSAKLAEAAVMSIHIGKAAINEAHIAELAVGSAAIQNLAVKNQHVDNIHADKITAGIVAAERIAIGPLSQFAPGFDPSTKETPQGAQDKADAAKNAAIKYTDDNTGNLLKNPAVTGSTTGWSASGLSVVNQTFQGASTRVLQSSVSANTQNYSDYFYVDPSKAYEVSMWFKKSASAGRVYFGLNGLDINGSTIGFERVDSNGILSNLNDTNFYFWYTGANQSPIDWIKIVGYIMPSGTEYLDMKGIGTSSNAVMKPTTRRIRVRFLNYDNGGTARQLWVANPKVVEVDPNSIVRGTFANDTVNLWRYQDTLFIDGGDLYANSVTANQIASNAVTADKIAANAVTADKIEANAVTASKIQAEAVGAQAIAAEAILAKHIAAGEVKANHIAASAVTADAIATGAILAKHISSKQITADKLNVSSLSAVSANLGNITAGTLKAVTLEGVTGTFGNVSVKDGDFLLKDGSSNISYSIMSKTNYVDDHSFELVDYQVSTINHTYNWAEIYFPYSISMPVWDKVGNPKAAIDLDVKRNATPIFGERAVVVRSTDRIKQRIWGLESGETYTLSAFFKRQWNVAAGGTPRFTIRHIDAITFEETTIKTETFSAVPSDYSVVRYSTTFTTPSNMFEYDDIEIEISTGNSNWVQVDGVQLVKGSTPSVYNDESSLWKTLSGRLRASNLFVNGSVRVAGSEGAYVYTNAVENDVAGVHLYLRSLGEIRTTANASTTQYIPLRTALVYTDAVDTTATNIYLRPTSSGEARVTATGSTTAYRPLRAQTLYADLNVYSGNNGAFASQSGYVVLRAEGGIAYIQSDTEGRMTRVGQASSYMPFRASSFPTGSLAEYKENITVWEESALDLINSATIYDYQLKTELEQGIARNRQGLVIGKGFNTPEGVIDGDGVEQYLMNAWSWKAIQELSAKIDALERKIS